MTSAEEWMSFVEIIWFVSLHTRYRGLKQAIVLRERAN